MSGLTPAQRDIIRSLIDTCPDTAIQNLDQALHNESAGPMAEIRDLVSAEAEDRRARRIVFGPLAPMCPRQTPRMDRMTFPAAALALLWEALKAAEPNAASIAAMAANASYYDEDADCSAFDALCARAATGLRAPEGSPFAEAAERLDAARPGGAALCASYLDLVPLARGVLRKAPEWLARMTDERAAAARLAFRDAGEISPDAGPIFFELLFASLEEPWQILRVVSAVMDRPSDNYMAASELAGIGERLLADIDRRLDDLRAFNPQSGQAAGVEAGECARIAVLEITEFEQTLDLKRDGPWGLRLGKQKRQLAQAVESLMNKVDDAVGGALPMKTVRFAGRMMRGMPKLAGEPDERAVGKAEGLLAFLDATRASATPGGYASFRAKVVEKVETRLDQYSEDLIEILRDPENEERIQASLYLEVTARFIGFVRDEKAAQIIRRRAAA